MHYGPQSPDGIVPQATETTGEAADVSLAKEAVQLPV